MCGSGWRHAHFRVKLAATNHIECFLFSQRKQQTMHSFHVLTIPAKNHIIFILLAHVPFTWFVYNCCAGK